MLIHVYSVVGPSFDLQVESPRSYDSIVNEIVLNLKAPPASLALYHNQKALGKTAVFDPESGPPDFNVTVLNSFDFPRLSFPTGERLFNFDFGRFDVISVRNCCPFDAIPRVNRKPRAREIIRNIGFEFGDPYSMRRTLTLDPRPDHASEARLMFQEMSGELEEAEMEKERRAIGEADLSDNRLAAIERICGIGISRDIVLQVFLDEECSEATTFNRLLDL
jgi:hypothetical protein